MEDKKIKEKINPDGGITRFEGEEELVKDPKKSKVANLKKKWADIKKSLLEKKLNLLVY